MSWNIEHKNVHIQSKITTWILKNNGECDWKKLKEISWHQLFEVVIMVMDDPTIQHSDYMHVVLVSTPWVCATKAKKVNEIVCSNV